MKYLILLLLLTGCAQEKSVSKTPNFIEKQGILIANRMEATPIIWNDGRLLLVVAAREQDLIEVYDGNTLIASHPTTLGLGSAFMDNGTLYIFGATSWENVSTNTIEMFSTTDLVNWSTPIEVQHSISNRVYYNSSVTKLPDGSYLMAAETCEPGTTCFSARFFTSNDLINWSETGAIFKPEIYAACPTIRFIEGFYYVFYLKAYDGQFATHLSRSRDLVHWDDAKLPVLVAADDAGSGNNASDMDFVEANGELFINYADGDQLTWTNIRTAKYKGTLESFVKEFYKE